MRQFDQKCELSWEFKDVTRAKDLGEINRALVDKKGFGMRDNLG